jgi:hypothetical protein
MRHSLKASSGLLLAVTVAGGLILASGPARADDPPAPGTTPTATAIKPDHPRLYNITQRLPALRQNACYDANGNKLSGCTPTPEYTDFYNSDIANGSGEPWNFALMYMITHNASYATTAIDKVKAMISDGMGVERQDYFLQGHYFVRNAAIVYDWLYDLMSASERAQIVNYMNQVVSESTNPQTNPCRYSSGWSQNNPRDNYYYRHVLSAALLAIATYGENPGTVTYQDCTASGGTHPLVLTYNGVDYTDPLQFVYAKLDDQAVPWIVGRESGGGWREGTNYGRASKILMLEIFQVLRDGGGRNYFNEIGFPRQAADFFFYELQPGNLYHYTPGDAPRDPLERANDSDLHLLRLLVDGEEGTTESQYAQFWINSYAGLASDKVKKAFNFFLAKQGYPTRDYRLDLPLSYYSPGSGYVNSRSDWTANAVSVNFTSTARVAEHTHKNQNEFAIFRGDWQTVSGNTYSNSGLNQDTQIHNTILVNHDGQHFGEGTGDIIKYEAKPEYTYAVGDASDAYYSNASGWGGGYNKMTTVFQRELVHLQPDVIVVYDRVTPTAAYADKDVTYLLNSKNKAAINGREVTLANGGGKLFQLTVMPAGAAISNVSASDGSASWWRVEVNDPPAPHHQFLHVLYAAAPGATSMPAVTTVTELGNKAVGVKVTVGGQERVLTFSTDPTGASVPGNLMLDLGEGNAPSLNLLYDMVPLAGYDVQVSVVDGHRRVSVREGTRYVASARGVLEFRIPEAPEQVALSAAARP